MICISHPIFSGDKIEKNELGRACRTYGGGERCLQGSGGETLWERDHLGEPDVEGRIVLRWILRKWDVEVSTGTS